MNTTSNSWNAQQCRLLRPYVTNLEKPIFALCNLPEVLKGALFSRYSRSKHGLRELLLKEFIPENTTEKQEPLTEILDIQRAEEFYRRVLDNYGDDSVGELGGAHLALEQISMLAAKSLQDSRIGGSSLEKSTRYLSFADQHQGEYKFYRDPRLLASAHRELYLKTCHDLFQGYQDLWKPMFDFFDAQPKKNIPEKSWNIIVKTKTFDSLRGILPTSALTNMGIFGNGRFFETLLQRLANSPLSECRHISESALQELKKVIPSFVRRAELENKHFQAQQNYWQELNKNLQQWADKQAIQLTEDSQTTRQPDTEPQATEQQIRLLKYDTDAPARVAAALGYEQSLLPLETLHHWTQSKSEQELRTIFENLGKTRGNRRHKPPRATELAFYTFECTADYGMFRDLHRHRMLTQQRQLLTPKLGWTIPPEIQAASQNNQFAQLMQQAARAHQQIAKDFPQEAQYVIPMAFHVRWYMHINLRSLIWLTELRSTEQGHPAYRAAAQTMAQLVQSFQPVFSPLFTHLNNTITTRGRVSANKDISTHRQASLLQ